MLKLYNARVLGVLNNNVNGSPTMVLIFCDLPVIFKFIPKGKKQSCQNYNKTTIDLVFAVFIVEQVANVVKVIM